MEDVLKNKKGSSMLLAVCLFLVLAVLGINLLNAASANVNQSGEEYEKEQAMLYVSSIYEIVNNMIEEGEFSDGDSLPASAEAKGEDAFPAGDGEKIEVSIRFYQESVIRADVTITLKGQDGGTREFTVVTTYSNVGEPGKFKRISCKGLVENGI